jgi:hypothetical protein
VVGNTKEGPNLHNPPCFQKGLPSKGVALDSTWPQGRSFKSCNKSLAIALVNLIVYIESEIQNL